MKRPVGMRRPILLSAMAVATLCACGNGALLWPHVDGGSASDSRTGDVVSADGGAPRDTDGDDSAVDTAGDGLAEDAAVDAAIPVDGSAHDQGDDLLLDGASDSAPKGCPSIRTLPGEVAAFEKDHPKDDVGWWAESLLDGTAVNGQKEKVMATASAQKGFYLVALYRRYKSVWESTPPEWNDLMTGQYPLVTEATYATMTPAEFESRYLVDSVGIPGVGATGIDTYREVARAMMGGWYSDIGNDGYNTAANIVIFLLRGKYSVVNAPKGCTEAVRKIDPEFSTVTNGRYMGQDSVHSPWIDNVNTARDFAKLVRMLFQRKYPGLNALDHQRIKDCWNGGKASWEAGDGDRYDWWHKVGLLTNPKSVRPAVSSVVEWIEVGGNQLISVVIINNWSSPAQSRWTLSTPFKEKLIQCPGSAD